MPLPKKMDAKNSLPVISGLNMSKCQTTAIYE
jgi:hypothetical protein